MSEQIDLAYLADAKTRIERLKNKRREIALDMNDLRHEIYSKMLDQGVNYDNCGTMIDDASIVNFLRGWILDE